MKFKFKSNLFYDKNKIKSIVLILTLAVIIANIFMFIVFPIQEILAKKQQVKKIIKEKVVLEKQIEEATKKNQSFYVKLEEAMVEKDSNRKLLEGRSFRNIVEFEKTLQEVLNKLDINVISVDKNYLDDKNEIEGTKNILTDFTLEGEGSKIAELYNLIENSSKLMFIKNKEFEIVKETTNRVKAKVTVEYFILDGIKNDTKLIKTIDDEELNELIRSYDQKRNIFRENLNVKKSAKETGVNHKVDYKTIYKNRFKLVEILTVEDSSSAILYYHSPKKGLIRLIISKNRSIVLDGKRYKIEVSPTTVTVKNNREIIVRMHK